MGNITALAFNARGDKLISGGEKGVIQVWNVGSNGLLTRANRFVGHSDDVKTITVSRDGKYVLSGGDDKKIHCWELANSRGKFGIAGLKRPVLTTFITRGGKQGLASDGEQVILIDMKEGKAIQRMDLPAGYSNTAAIAPDGSIIMVQDSYDLKGTELKTGNGPIVFEGRDIQWYATFLNNSRYILSGGSGKVNLWSVRTHFKIHDFRTRGSASIKTIAVSPDGQHFAAADSNAGAAIIVFRLPPEARSK
jgi:WD40 repeat protein